jgi:hypothetical protein
MNRELALKIVLAVVGLLFIASERVNDFETGGVRV